MICDVIKYILVDFEHTVKFDDVIVQNPRGRRTELYLHFFVHPFVTLVKSSSKKATDSFRLRYN